MNDIILVIVLLLITVPLHALVSEILSVRKELKMHASEIADFKDSTDE